MYASAYTTAGTPANVYVITTRFCPVAQATFQSTAQSSHLHAHPSRTVAICAPRRISCGMRRPVVFTLLVVCTGLVAGCGRSRHLSLGVQRAAITVAKRYSPGTSAFPTSPGTIDCRIPTRLWTGYYVGRCTSKVWPHGTGADVSFIATATKFVTPPAANAPRGPIGPSTAKHAPRPAGPTTKSVAGTGHATYLVDRHNRVHLVEISDFFP